MFAIVGGTCTFASLLVLAALHTSVAIVGIGWLAIGMIVYPVYRHRHGLDLTTTTKVAIPRPATETESEYESVLVVFDEGITCLRWWRPQRSSPPVVAAGSTSW